VGELREPVVVEVETGAAPSRLKGGCGPKRHVAVRVEVVAVRRRAAVLEEHLAAAASQHLLEVALVCLAGDLDRGRPGAARAAQAAHDVTRLVLDQVEVAGAVEA
jgi:hypothetical protein